MSDVASSRLSCDRTLPLDESIESEFRSIVSSNGSAATRPVATTVAVAAGVVSPASASSVLPSAVDNFYSDVSSLCCANDPYATRLVSMRYAVSSFDVASLGTDRLLSFDQFCVLRGVDVRSPDVSPFVDVVFARKIVIDEQWLRRCGYLGRYNNMNTNFKRLLVRNQRIRVNFRMALTRSSNGNARKYPVLELDDFRALLVQMRHDRAEYVRQFVALIEELRDKYLEYSVYYYSRSAVVSFRCEEDARRTILEKSSDDGLVSVVVDEEMDDCLDLRVCRESVDRASNDSEVSVVETGRVAPPPVGLVVPASMNATTTSTTISTVPTTASTKTTTIGATMVAVPTVPTTSIATIVATTTSVSTRTIATDVFASGSSLLPVAVVVSTTVVTASSSSSSPMIASRRSSFAPTYLTASSSSSAASSSVFASSTGAGAVLPVPRALLVDPSTRNVHMFSLLRFDLNDRCDRTMLVDRGAYGRCDECTTVLDAIEACDTDSVVVDDFDRFDEFAIGGRRDCCHVDNGNGHGPGRDGGGCETNGGGGGGGIFVGYGHRNDERENEPVLSSTAAIAGPGVASVGRVDRSASTTVSGVAWYCMRRRSSGFDGRFRWLRKRWPSVRVLCCFYCCSFRSVNVVYLYKECVRRAFPTIPIVFRGNVIELKAETISSLDPVRDRLPTDETMIKIARDLLIAMGSFVVVDDHVVAPTTLS